MNTLRFFASTPKLIEQLLADELKTFGAQEVQATTAGVAFSGSLEVAYRACLWSRFANRILLILNEFAAPDPDALYAGVMAIDWDQHLSPAQTMAVDGVVFSSQITHGGFAALRVKDAVVDYFRERCDSRPTVDTQRPDIQLNIRLRHDQAVLSLDLSGESLHRRGYRLGRGAAPLKENLAAAVLARSGWPEIAAAGGSFVDPMCGAATLVLEAALMAADIAPGLGRDYFGFLNWRGHDAELWARLREEARQRRRSGLQTLPLIRGFDADAAVVRRAQTNAVRAGLEGAVNFEQRSIRELHSADFSLPASGLLAINPPYGKRLGGEAAGLDALYADLGACLRREFAGWRAAVLVSNPELGHRIGLRAEKVHSFFNGTLPCKLLQFRIESDRFTVAADAGRADGESAEMLRNRLRKNLKSLAPWLKREHTNAYRIYDRDLPEYAVAIDRYGDWVHVQEYAPPKSIPGARAAARLAEIQALLPETLGVSAKKISYKTRHRQRGETQYEKIDESESYHQVFEGDCTFLVNLTDYLDTGLFLDHRPLRKMIGEMAAGCRFLNLFAYTGAATVHAAKGGALTTTTVDMSRTYLEWAQRNLELNGFKVGDQHAMLQADCLIWLRQQRREFDLIFLDPPTFSNSKRMTETFDVQRDHVNLIQQTARLLSADGILLFSNNFRQFKMDHEALSNLRIDDITARTIPQDFKRNPRIHHCWMITRT
ncbi:MAG: bifunctional 23S rRNA (guanine(2069)-N(7))-methyltransferase RlmK/23S rRNA (guanine(2445)-N(2))-methyltransferase RlmL [Desulfuromonadales bacterium]|nr:bifunctional 23S rRNA (guanine(2069)-N(7))-methyltransferase RlmK/23S rRNA (guanine(2445)-N(2))-methyltransferase RlmL [Desulfuromonadales bacterium]